MGLFDLIGVALSTILAMGYRTVYLVYYISRKILKRDPLYFVKHIVVDIISVFSILCIVYRIDTNVTDYLQWIGVACLVAIVSAVVIVLVNIVFYRGFLVGVVNKVLPYKKNK